MFVAWKMQARNIGISALLMAALASCSSRKAVEKAIREANSRVETGDKAILEEGFDLACEQYGEAVQGLKQVEGKVEGLPKPLQDLFDKTRKRASLRQSAFEEPSGGVEAAFRLTGDPDTKDVGFIFWDVETMCRQGLTEETWNSLSQTGREQLVELCSQALHDFLQNNQIFLREAKLTYHSGGQHEQGIRVRSTIRFGKDTIKAIFCLSDRSGPWRVTDMRLSVAGMGVAQLIANTIAMMEELHPLEELLKRKDASALMNKAAGLAMEKYSKKQGEAGSLVTLVKETTLVTEAGETFQIPGGRAVELLGQRRTTEGVVQVRVRVLGHVDADLSNRPTAGSQVGWIQETSLPSTGEEEIWGGEW